jgi:hypothetical protein
LLNFCQYFFSPWPLENHGDGSPHETLLKYLACGCCRIIISWLNESIEHHKGLAEHLLLTQTSLVLLCWWPRWEESHKVQLVNSFTVWELGQQEHIN